MLLAGLAPDFEAAQEMVVSGKWSGSDADESTVNIPDSPLVEASGSWTVPQADRSALIEAGRFLLFRFLPVGVSFAAFGYVLSLLGWDSRQVQSASTVFALAVVLGEAVLLSDREAGLRDFFRASLFLVLTTPLPQFAPLGMDPYNFHFVAGLNEV